MELEKVKVLVNELGLYSKQYKDYLLIETEQGYIKFTIDGEIIRGE